MLFNLCILYVKCHLRLMNIRRVGIVWLIWQQNAKKVHTEVITCFWFKSDVAIMKQYKEDKKNTKYSININVFKKGNLFQIQDEWFYRDFIIVLNVCLITADPCFFILLTKWWLFRKRYDLLWQTGCLSTILTIVHFVVVFLPFCA